MGKHAGEERALEPQVLPLPEVLELIDAAYDEGYLAGFNEAVQNRDDCDHSIRWWEVVAYAVSVLVMTGSIWLMLNHPGWLAH